MVRCSSSSGRASGTSKPEAETGRESQKAATRPRQANQFSCLRVEWILARQKCLAKDLLDAS
jgi:hypothetical protein